MLAKSAPKILSTKGECTFLFSDFLINILCTSLDSYLFSELIPVALCVLEADLSARKAFFLSKNM